MQLQRKGAMLWLVNIPARSAEKQGKFKYLNQYFWSTIATKTKSYKIWSPLVALSTEQTVMPWWLN